MVQWVTIPTALPIDRMLAAELESYHPGGVTLEGVAHSGAAIGAFGAAGIPCPGEVPCSRLTILEQCDQFTNSPETVDLVLLDGGINDVGVATILIPSLSSQLSPRGLHVLATTPCSRCYGELARSSRNPSPSLRLAAVTRPW